VVRSNRLLKTVGEVVQITNGTRDGVRLLWVKWLHPTTMPNPSLELEDQLDRVVPEDARRSDR
jgi:hypothetical protein